MFAPMTEDTKNWWSDQIKSLGFPMVVCIAFMYGGWHILNTYIAPTFAKQMQTLEVVTETQAKMVDKLETMATDISIHKQILTELTSSQKDALTTLKEIEKNTSK